MIRPARPTAHAEPPPPSRTRPAFAGSARHTGFVLPILKDGLASNTPAPSSAIEGLALVEALWARMCEGTREDGTTIEPNDPIWPELNKAAKAARSRPGTWLDQHHLYGDLATTPAFTDPFERWLTQLWAEGCEATLRTYLGR